MIKWTDIESFYHIVRHLKATDNTNITVKYRSKIKLDGNNAGINLYKTSEGASIIPQSRNNILTLESDNIKFAEWTNNHTDIFVNARKNANSLGVEDHLIVFGEFAGKGIQKRCSISKIDRKIFAIFAIQFGMEEGYLETDPDKIKKLLGFESLDCNDIYILPWLNLEIDIDFSNKDSLESAVEKLNSKVEEIEACDPWVKDTFGVEGLGEGMVLYPIFKGNTLIKRSLYSDFVFKAKGDKHKVVKVKKPVQIDPEVASSIDDFVDLFVTENRLEQIAGQFDGFDLKNTGAFLKAFCTDVLKESKVELEDAKLDWKTVSGKVQTKARVWWMNKSKDII